MHARRNTFKILRLQYIVEIFFNKNIETKTYWMKYLFKKQYYDNNIWA